MLRSGDVVSYLEMCAPFGVNLQRGMNFRLRNGESLILMSLRPGAPYEPGARYRQEQHHDQQEDSNYLEAFGNPFHAFSSVGSPSQCYSDPPSDAKCSDDRR